MSTTTVQAWKAGQSYAVGDLVSYDGVIYQALVPETAVSTWLPTVTPALWKPVATTGGTATTTSSTTTTTTAAAPATTPAVSSAAPAAWSATAVYTVGMTVSENGVIYQANWWTQGNDPAGNNGVIGTGQPWTLTSAVGGSSSGGTGSGGTASGGTGSGGTSSGGTASGGTGSTGTTGPAAWSATAVYTAGMTASENGAIYQANWWTQGNDPASNNGATGTGQPWTLVSASGGAASVPGVPAGLTAIATSATAVTLEWKAVNGATRYVVFANGKQVATTTSAVYTATGLTAGTKYSFTVEAVAAAGASAQTSALSVTTGAAGSAHAVAFAPYVDMGLMADANVSGIAQAAGLKSVTLAFIQSSGTGTIGWSGVGTLADDTLTGGSTILAQVKALQATGDSVTISFGGSAGIDPAAAASSAKGLQALYQSVLDRYHVTSLDFDIEGAEVADSKSMALRDQALAGLKAANPGLTISYTLPVLPTGLDSNGLKVLQTAKADGLTPDIVNLMTMDYGASVDQGGDMGKDAIDAIVATEAQLKALGMAAKIGVTPMIGVNDISTEIFTLANAQQLVDYIKSDPNVARVAMWSIARDNGAGAGQTYASADTSGVAQAQYAFAKIFAGA